MSRRFCVMVHDVTPAFSEEIDQILDHLQPIVGKNVSGAVVPAWHGRQLNAIDRGQFQVWDEMFGELLLHGWTHYRQQHPGLVSWLTGRSDEFTGLSPEEARDILSRAQSEMKSVLGTSLRGFVAPAWQFPCQLADIRRAEVEYVMGFQHLESAQGKLIPLATWSWDWGWLDGASRLGAFLGNCRRIWCPNALPVIVLHPIDLRRRHVRHALNLIREFLQEGWKPVLPGEMVGSLVNGTLP
ncbi:MAG: putative deacetylase [Planctomycetaceae bacterium]|nr:putative deacetylase [Planctomycetaceae bacterium]